MSNLQISFDSEINPQDLRAMNPEPLKIFEWVCLTLNSGGYVPHIYELDKKSMKFVLRKVEGTKVKLNFKVQMKIVSLANYMFRIKQQNWPVVVTQDIQNFQYLNFWRICVTGEVRSITDDFDAENPFAPAEATTLFHPESDHQ